MSNKSKKAIESLNKHLNDIENISNVQQGNTWKARLKDSINLYIGENSSISQRLDKLYFTRKEYSTVEGVIGVFDEHVYDESKKQNFKDLINSAIKHIESNGIYRNPNKKNFLSSFSNAEMIGGIVVAIGIVYGIGNYFGKLEKDREIIQSENKMKETESQIKTLNLENNRLKKVIDSLNQEIKEVSSKIDLEKNDTTKKIK